MTHQVPIEISGRHLHISQTDLEKLFGVGAQLTSLKPVSQPDQFAANETVEIVGPKSSFKVLRIVGPVRSQTQIELSMTDARALGLDATLKVSGNLEGTSGGVKLIGPKGEVDLQDGVIIAQRHLHIEPAKAKEWGIKTGDIVKVKIDGARGLVFDQVAVRSHEGIDKLAVHLDTDEANAAGLVSCGMGELIIEK